MSFQPVKLSGSGQIQSMVNNLAPALEQLTTSMATGMGNVSGLLPSGSFDVSQLGKLGREETTKALRSKVQTLTITPYNSGLRKGDRSYLTPENALQKLVSVFDQAQGKDEKIGVIVLTFLAESEKRLAESLKSFNAIFPLEELQRIERKARALSTLDRDKFVIPDGPGYPAWGQTSPANEKTGQNFNKVLGGLVGADEGQTASPSLSRLSAFAQKQAGKIADKLKAMQDMVSAMQGEDSAWQGAYFAGSFVEVRRFVKDLVPPPDATTNAAFKTSALVCLTGKPDHLTFYKESFGL